MAPDMRRREFHSLNNDDSHSVHPQTTDSVGEGGVSCRAIAFT
jgi:hypothetical protein